MDLTRRKDLKMTMMMELGLLVTKTNQTRVKVTPAERQTKSKRRRKVVKKQLGVALMHKLDLIVAKV